jgi:hypothetical protein
MMAELVKTSTLYGDGSTLVKADAESVTFSQDGESIIVSHATMREIVLSWERHEERETE